jgi:4-amino-4-deoxy-L-arabinose transferase-like glycosyltransferase
MPTPEPISRRQWWFWLAAALLLALVVRAAFPLADPPWRSTIGITWHDEGVWAHNARNKALFGAWRLDEWNPVYVSPVFTALEYASFSVLGVGLWQARLVSVIAGVAATFAIALGLRAIASPAAGLIGALLLALNFTWVMYSRVALLEATMIAALAGSWACYVRMGRDWRWGTAAAALGLVAFFTKASAAFFLVALGLDGCWVVWRAWRGRTDWRSPEVRGAVATLATLAAGTLLALAMFVGPHWAEYSFYNLFVYGSRRSSVGPGPLMDRVSWFPVVHGFFTRQWLLTLAALAGLAALLSRYRRASAGERLLALWFLLGVFELVLHDLGNERRYVFLVPAMTALAALLLMHERRLVPAAVAAWPRRAVAASAPLLAAGLYVLAGSAARQAAWPDVSLSVRSGAAIAVVVTVALAAGWRTLGPRLGRLAWSPRAALAAVAVIAAIDSTLVLRWAMHRTYRNHEASRAVGRLLPAGTLVQGKLANGLALDNGIRPLFIGPGFGNFGDRLRRPDVPWILTYSRPRLGYEGAVIRELLDAAPGWEVAARFPVAETSAGDDEAVLIRKAAR